MQLKNNLFRRTELTIPNTETVVQEKRKICQKNKYFNSKFKCKNCFKLYTEYIEIELYSAIFRFPCARAAYASCHYLLDYNIEADVIVSFAPNSEYQHYSFLELLLELIIKAVKWKELKWMNVTEWIWNMKVIDTII